MQEPLQEEELIDSEPKPVLVQDLWLGLLESIINNFIDLDAETKLALSERQGLIIRVKTVDPYAVFYAHITSTGVELSSESLGVARVRISGSFLGLMGALVGGHGVGPRGRLQIWGEREQADWVRNTLRQFNLRTSAQRWLKSHVNITELWQKVRQNDPSWISDLMPMPAMLKEALAEIRALQGQLAEQQVAWQAQQSAWQSQRRWDIVIILTVLTALVLSLLPGTDIQERLHGLSSEHILWVAMAFTVISTRFWRR